MNRRGFLAGLGLAPVAGVAAMAAKPAFASGGVVKAKVHVVGERGPETIVPLRRARRVSCIKGDPGERLWAELRGDDRKMTVFLDGVEQRDAVTADETEGFVYRDVRTPTGNLAVTHDEILRETVYGDVKIVIE